MEKSSQLLRGVLDMCLLALLGERDCYGYEIVRRLGERGLTLVAEGSVYPVLSRLERDGLTEGYWAQPSGGPRRKYYRLSPNGQEQLARWRRDWREFTEVVDAVVEGGAHAGAT